MAKSVPNENIINLRRLSDELCKVPTDDYKFIVKKLKAVIENGKKEIEKTDESVSKIKCYESMCTTINNLLSTVKF